MLTTRIKAGPYGEDGSFAGEINQLPIGLRAIAATYHLGISLSLDDIGWHFFNFGEAAFVDETATGLQELGLSELADWFDEARQIANRFWK